MAKKVVRRLAIFVAVAGVFLGGVVVGVRYNLTDLLCPMEASPYRLEADLVSEEGIVFPQGTIVPLRRCADMQRFEWNFAIDNSVRLTPAKVEDSEHYGFSVIAPAEQARK
ncbi:hypothetical protein EUZ85_11390 [Hahella sp. KA22]|uniref:hypothetical protein n=1 Tax=Hahella sp. KA22 TaxID=1628392 RepID=UPI000FDECFF3|nr:hypothetical protein [Hahella sp. KA22]AZZ91299.1 hypothetical protein ENC22_08830 [Hahella sp. KA22]QAY54668.1 hypothetical protein EUZ85_11390 [Hahella sp. KA22]